MFNITISSNDLTNLRAFLLRTQLAGTEVSAFYKVFIALDGAKAIEAKVAKIKSQAGQEKTKVAEPELQVNAEENKPEKK